MAMSPGYGLKLLQAPTWEPVVPGDMVHHSRIAPVDIDNGVIAGYILTAREYVETATKRAIAQQQWLLTVDEFPGRQVDDYRPPTWRYGIFRLPFAPLISVDQVAYIDPGVSGAQPFALTIMTPDEYQVDTYNEPGRLAPAPFKVWPATNPLAFQAVQITFTAGWATAALVPARIKQAIKLLAAHLYEHREATTEESLSKIPLGLAAMISSCGIHEYD